MNEWPKSPCSPTCIRPEGHTGPCTSFYTPREIYPDDDPDDRPYCDEPDWSAMTGIPPFGEI